MKEEKRTRLKPPPLSFPCSVNRYFTNAKQGWNFKSTNSTGAFIRTFRTIYGRPSKIKPLNEVYKSNLNGSDLCDVFPQKIIRLVSITKEYTLWAWCRE